MLDPKLWKSGAFLKAGNLGDCFLLEGRAGSRRPLLVLTSDGLYDSVENNEDVKLVREALRSGERVLFDKTLLDAARTVQKDPYADLIRPKDRSVRVKTLEEIKELARKNATKEVEATTVRGTIVRTYVLINKRETRKDLSDTIYHEQRRGKVDVRIMCEVDVDPKTCRPTVGSAMPFPPSKLQLELKDLVPVTEAHRKQFVDAARQIASKGISAWTRAQVQAMSLHKHLSILSAVRHGDKHALRSSLFAAGHDVNILMKEGVSLLGEACRLNGPQGLDCCRLLLDAKANVELPEGPVFLLHAAPPSMSPYLRMSRFISRLKMRMRPLHSAAMVGNIACVKMLLDAGAQILSVDSPISPLNAEPSTKKGEQPTRRRRRRRYEEEEEEEEKESSKGRKSLGWTAIEIACCCGQWETLLFLLLALKPSKGKKLELQTPASLQAPHALQLRSCRPSSSYARMRHGEEEGVLASSTLVQPHRHPLQSSFSSQWHRDRLADDLDIMQVYPRQDAGGRNLLHIAVLSGRNDMVESMLAHKAWPMLQLKDANGQTPIVYAARSSNAQLFQFCVAELNKRVKSKEVAASDWRSLLSSGSPPKLVKEEEQHQDWTLLHHAALEGSAETVEAILSTDVNPNAQDAHGLSALHLAVFRQPEQTKVIDLLVNFSADINAKDKKGRSPLHVATFLGSFHAISRILFAPRLLIDAQDSRGYTALMIAVEDGDSELASYLMNAGAFASSSSGRNALSLAVKSKDEDMLGQVLVQQWSGLSARPLSAAVRPQTGAPLIPRPASVFQQAPTLPRMKGKKATGYCL